MQWFIYPDKDATMYKSQPNQNAGLDEILEITKLFYADSTTEIARALVHFDLSAVSASIVAGNITDPTYYLNCRITAEDEVPLSYTASIHAVSQSWEMGVGTLNDAYTTTGVSWNYRNSALDTGSIWVPDVGSGSTATYVAGTTGSLDGRGGTWYTGSEYETSTSWSYANADLRVDVTAIVNKWLDGTIDNDGFIIKHTTSSEANSLDYGRTKYFSTDTNTIYPPKLEVTWDDSTQSTGSLAELTGSDILVYMKNMRQEYKDGSKVKFRVMARDRYPAKSFATSSQYLTVKYLPTGSFLYSVEDANTHEQVITFSPSSTKVSVDTSGNFFTLWTSGLQVERFYRIIFKLSRDDGTVEYFDDDYIFKLIR